MLQSPYFLYRTELGTAPPAPARCRSTTGRWAPSSPSRSPTRFRTTRCSRPPRRGSCTTAPESPRRPSGCSTVRRARRASATSTCRCTASERTTASSATRRSFPDFKPNAPAAMKQEVLQFLNWMFTQGRGIKDFYTTPVGLRGLAARPDLRRHRQLLERSGHADEGRPRSDPAFGTADPGRVPVVLHLGWATSRTSSIAACSSRPGSCARRCRRPDPEGRRNDDPATRRT